MTEQVLMRTQDRSESASDAALLSSSSSSSGGGPSVSGAGGFKETSAMQKRIQKLSRKAIASFKNSLNLDSVRDSPVQPGRVDNCIKHFWAGVVRNLTQQFIRAVSFRRSSFPIFANIMILSLPLSAGFEMKDVFIHMKLIEQASGEDHPAAIMIQQVSDDEVQGSVYKRLYLLVILPFHGRLCRVHWIMLQFAVRRYRSLTRRGLHWESFWWCWFNPGRRNCLKLGLTVH